MSKLYDDIKLRIFSIKFNLFIKNKTVYAVYTLVYLFLWLFMNKNKNPEAGVKFISKKVWQLATSSSMPIVKNKKLNYVRNKYNLNARPLCKAGPLMYYLKWYDVEDE